MKHRHDRQRALRRERIQASPLWTGQCFENQHPVLPGLRDPAVKTPSVREFLWGGPRRVPERPLPSLDPRDRWQHDSATGLRATWLGHSTVLLEMDGLCVLTDPVWGPRASPSKLVGPKRFQPVPVSIADLPPLDVVVISHDHYDHLDYVTIRELARTEVHFVTSLGVGGHLESWGVAPGRITELDWWETWTLPHGDLAVTAAPSQHFSGRGVRDRNATLWSSFAIRSARHYAFFSGDTGLTTQYELIRQQLGPFDLVMLEVGAFHPSWGHIHLGPENALTALELLGGGAFLPVHWGTFALAVHDWDDPAETLLALAPERDVTLLMPRLGEVLEVSQSAAPTPWWRTADRHVVSRSVDQPEVPAVAEVLPDPID